VPAACFSGSEVQQGIIHVVHYKALYEFTFFTLLHFTDDGLQVQEPE